MLHTQPCEKRRTSTMNRVGDGEGGKPDDRRAGKEFRLPKPLFEIRAGSSDFAVRVAVRLGSIPPAAEQATPAATHQQLAPFEEHECQLLDDRRAAPRRDPCAGSESHLPLAVAHPRQLPTGRLENLAEGQMRSGSTDQIEYNRHRNQIRSHQIRPLFPAENQRSD